MKRRKLLAKEKSKKDAAKMDLSALERTYSDSRTTVVISSYGPTPLVSDMGVLSVGMTRRMVDLQWVIRRRMFK